MKMSKIIFSIVFLIMFLSVQIINCDQASKYSLAIVFDVTGSMSDEADALRYGVKLLIETFTSRANNPISDYVFVQFRDQSDEMQLPPIVETDVNHIYKILETIEVTGGGDCLEACFRGIKKGLELAKDNSIMFVFTDAGTHHKEIKAELETLVQRKKIMVYFFLTAGCGREDHEIKYYQDLADTSNGLVFDVDYRQIKQHFPSYREVINENLGLNSVIKGPAGKSNVNVEVDSSMKEFTFTIVAQKPLVTIYDPKHNLIRDFEVLTDLPTIKMIKVKEPEPGTWKVEVETSSPYTGQVSVISDLSFKYGFAVFEPDDITQTSFSPLIGENNFLAILPSDPNLISNLEYVVLQTKSTPYKHSLRKKTVANGDLYITDSITLPKEPFKVMLHGVDPINHAIKRLLSPDIASLPPNKPGTELIPKINVQEGEPIYLICRVDSMVQITISWFKVGQSTALKSLTSKQSNVLNHTIAVSDISDDGDYLCVAENSAGKSESRTVVDVRRTILNVNTPIKQHTPKIGTKSLVLKCVVTPKIAAVRISWLFNGSPTLPRGSVLNLPNLILNNIERSFNGTYTCVAQRKAEIIQDNIEVIVYYPAKILNIFNLSPYRVVDISKPIEVYDQSELKLMCGHEGNPPSIVKWINRNGDTVSNTLNLDVNGNDTRNAGDYLCQVENSVGKDEKRVKVEIAIAPKLLVGFQVDYRVILNDRFSLECPLEVVPHNKMAIEWYQNGSRIHQRSIFNDRVKIDRLDHVHNGKYKCRASNKAGTVATEFNVNVLYEPSILNIVKRDNTGSEVLDPSEISLEVYNVTTFSMTCIVNGNPPPVTVWKKDGIIFSRTNQLQINPADTGFSGAYVCFTQNELNSDERGIVLYEIVKPKLTAYAIEQHLIEDEEFRMICPVEPGDYDVEWYYNNNNFNSHKPADGSLFIEKVYPNMAGSAYCVATNKAGTAVATFNFDVLRPPYGLSVTTSSYLNRIRKIGPNRKEIALTKNAPFDMTCNAQGNPMPNFYWMKNNRIFTTDKSIEIRSVDPKDAATYICVAQNVLGNQTEKIDVIVYIPPYLLNTTGLENSTNINNVHKLGVTVLNRLQVPNTYFKANYEINIKVNESEKVVLNCDMNGNPRPVVNWFKNAENLNKQTAVLEFTSIKVEDSGIYKCVGTNPHGGMSVIYYVNVHKRHEIVSATSTKAVYKQGEEIKFTCKTIGNQLPIIVWRSRSGMTDNENLIKTNDNDLKQQLLQRDESMYLARKKFIKPSDIDSLDRYGRINYEFKNGEYIGTLEYVIKSAKFSDAGAYNCTTRIYKVKKSQITEQVTIEVVEAPYIEYAETEYSILQGIDAHKIKCPINGIPRPTIEWYRESSLITSNPNFNVRNHFLEFKNPMLHHAGEYSCRGTNNGGTVEFKFKVIIFTHIADISNIVLNRSRKTKIVVRKNETKQLECSFKVTPIYWSKIVDAYPTKQRQLLEANATYNFYADVPEVIMCSKEADPQYGEIFEITVLEKPIIQTADENVEIKLDDVLRLQCDATGEPKPTIQWYKYVQGQRHKINNYPEFVASGETLFKRRAENSDTTKYVCIARNIIGEDSHIFNVTVLNDSHYFSPWTEWSTCTKTCGEGIQYRTRDCVHASCNRTKERTEQKCTIIECPVDGGWTDYSPFGQCSKTCIIDLADPGTKQARRECNNPAPAFGGRNCIGNSVRVVNCTLPLCESVASTRADELIYPSCSDQDICCPVGYVYDEEKGGCPEIDKCKRKGPYAVCRQTSQVCQNVGLDDYECVCRTGFELRRTRKHNPKNPKCVDINECKMAPYPCGLKRCSNSLGSYKCV